MFNRCLIFISLVFALTHSQCIPNYALNNFQTGIIQFQTRTKASNSSNKNYYFQIFSHQYFSSFKTVPSLSFGLTNLQYINLESTSFYIRSLNMNLTGTQFMIFAYESWKMLAISFIIIGSEEGVTLGSTQFTPTNTSIIEINIDTGKNYLKAVSRIWLNGLLANNPSQATRNTSFGVLLTYHSLTVNSLVISVDNLQLQNLTKIFLSYLIFVPSVSNFTSYGDQLSYSNFSGVTMNLVSQNLYRSQYFIFGLSGISLNSQPSTLIVSFSSSFLTTIYSSGQIDQLTINYVVFGSNTIRMCQCDNNATKYAFQNQCLSQCPNNTYVNKYKDGGLACLSCNQNLFLTLSTDKTSCECISGYYFDDNYNCIKLIVQVKSKSPINNVTPSFSINSSVINIITSINNLTSTNNLNSVDYISTSNLPSTPNIVNNSAFIQNKSTSNSTTSNLIISSGVNNNVSNSIVTQSNSNVVTQSKSNISLGNNLLNQPNQPNQPNQFQLLNSTNNAEPITIFPPKNTIISTSTSVNPPTSSNMVSISNTSGSVTNTANGSFMYSPSGSMSISGSTSQQYCLSTIPNSYWDGMFCSCKAGYTNASGKCQVITLQKSIFSQNTMQTPSIPLWTIQTANSTNNTSNPTITCPSFQYLKNETCFCINGYVRINGICSYTVTTCASNQYYTGSVCTCLPKFYRNSQGTCQYGSTVITCGSKQINNGLGICICQPNYYNISGSCVAQTPCAINSNRASNGSCICLIGYYNINGACSQCPQSQYWNASSKSCTVNCGVNSIYNQTSAKCICIPNYAILNYGTCQLCIQSGWFISNNYCVTCQLNQIYDVNTKRCTCETGYYLSTQGQCIAKCSSSNEYFDIKTSSCLCIALLGRVNNTCQICPSNSYINPVTQICTFCPINQIYSSSASSCVCTNGFALSDYNLCVPCSAIPNSYISGGNCAVCAGKKKYDGNQCVCPVGTIAQGTKCVNSCNIDQLVDSQGNCYTCPINQIISNGQCLCIANYQRINGICSIACPAGYFSFKGTCAVCPSNQIFNSILNGCVCQDGFYLNNQNQCVKWLVPSTACSNNMYYDSTYGCLSCSSNCQQCLSSSTCQICTYPYTLLNGVCQSICGNGLITPNEQCDDNNTVSGDGCSSTCKIQSNYACVNIPSICNYVGSSSKCGNGLLNGNQTCDDANNRNGDGCSPTCQVEQYFTCTGQPSVCIYNMNNRACGNGLIQLTQTCDDKNIINGDGCSSICSVEANFTCSGQPSVCVKSNPANITNLKLYSSVKSNTNNVFIVLQTPQKFAFTSDAQMQNFMQTSYSNTQKPTTYCNQENSPNQDIWDCLLVYSSGVPNQLYNVTFTYNYNGLIGNLTVNVNPLASNSSPVRSLQAEDNTFLLTQDDNLISNKLRRY